MNKFNCFLMILVILTITTQAQILNGSFEQWVNGEPAYWLSNNIDDTNIKLTPIVQTGYAHSGSFALKGEVVEIEQNGYTQTYAPSIKSGDKSGLYFSFTGRPKIIRGYYNFTSVGSDRLLVNVFLRSGNNLVAEGAAKINTSSGNGYHKLDIHLKYNTDDIPSLISIFVQILPPTDDVNSKVHLGSKFYIDAFPTILLKKPSEKPSSERLVIISGEVDTIKWEGGGAQNIDLEYSEDDGKNYQLIKNNYPADSNRYFWKVPKTLLSRKGKIRIKESQSPDNKPDNKKESQQVTFKPWQLTRIISNDKLELFEPNKHGWSFSNTSANVWPQSWWQQFDYQFGKDPNTNGKYPLDEPFISAKSSNFIDWPLFVSVFGESQCYYSTFFASYNSSATVHWAGIKGNWSGSCAGFAVTSLLGFYHKGSITSLIGGFSDLFSVPKNDDSRYVINFYYSYQYGKEVTTYRNASYSSVTPRMLLSDLKVMFHKENGDGRPLDFYSNNSSGGHTVTPYKLERIRNTSTFNLRLYDSRAPGSTNQIIFIDSTANTWTDNTGLGWGTGSKGCFLERESGTFLSKPTIPDVTSQMMAINKTVNSSSSMTIFNTSNADIIITSKNGDQIGYKDSVVFNDMNDGFPVIPFTGSFHPPIGYDLPNDSYSLKLNKFTDSLAYVYFMSDSTIYNYRRFNPGNDESDLLDFASDGLRITNPDPINKSIDLETIITQDSTSEKVFVTSNIDVSAGDSLNIGEKNRKELFLQNYGENSKYDLQIRFASAKGESIFKRNEVLINKNSSHKVVPAWKNLEGDPVKILIDNGNDGTIDDSLIVTNEVTTVKNLKYIGIPKEFKLMQNYPNPFNPSTTISFELPQKSKVTLTIYNTLGQKVGNLVNGVKQAGKHQIVYDASNLPNGVYIYSIKAGSYKSAKKMILLK